jgi:hypothetical protein
MLDQGYTTIYAKGSQPIFWAASQAATVKLTISGIPNLLN